MQLVRGVAHGEQHGDGHAALARGAVGGAHRRVRRQVHVRVGQHDHVVLGPAQGLHALAVARARLVDVAGDRGRAHEAHRGHVRVLEEAVHRYLVAVDHVEHAPGQTRLREELGRQVGGARVALRRLQHEAVAARERYGVHPHRHHGREVEGGDARDHPQGLADGVAVDLLRDVLGELALHQVGDPARELHDLEPPRDLALGVREDLPVLEREEAGEVVAPLHEQLAVGEHDLGALAEGGVAPFLERLLRRGHGAVDGGHVRVEHLGPTLAGRGVVDRSSAIASVRGSAVDPMTGDRPAPRGLRGSLRAVGGSRHGSLLLRFPAVA